MVGGGGFGEVAGAPTGGGPFGPGGIQAPVSPPKSDAMHVQGERLS